MSGNQNILNNKYGDLHGEEAGPAADRQIIPQIPESSVLSEGEQTDHVKDENSNIEILQEILQGNKNIVQENTELLHEILDIKKLLQERQSQPDINMKNHTDIAKKGETNRFV